MLLLDCPLELKSFLLLSSSYNWQFNQHWEDEKTFYDVTYAVSDVRFFSFFPVCVFEYFKNWISHSEENPFTMCVRLVFIAG